MLIEIWVAITIVVLLFLSNALLVISGILNDRRLEHERKRNDELQNELFEIKHYLVVQRTKNLINDNSEGEDNV